LRIRTDDEVYRVDAVWLGPPKATFPWRARYVAWGVGTVVFLAVLGVERQLGIGFSFFSTGWGLLITILLTRLIGSRISQKTAAQGGAASAAQIRVQRNRPRPRQGSARRRGRSRKEGDVVQAQTSPPQT
jgi:hypothetical protein